MPDPSGIPPLKLPDAKWIFYRNETGLISDNRGDKQAEDPPGHRMATYHHDIFGMIIGGEAKDDPTQADPNNIRLGARCGITFEKDNERARGHEIDGGRMVMWARVPDGEEDQHRRDLIDMGTTEVRFSVPIVDRFGREVLGNGDVVAPPMPSPGISGSRVYHEGGGYCTIHQDDGNKVTYRIKAVRGGPVLPESEWKPYRDSWSGNLVPPPWPVL